MVDRVDRIEDDRLIFVGGSPRSGTTLVQNMLDTHQDICGGPEFLHLPDVIGLRNKLHESIAKEWIVDFCSYDQVDGQIRALIQDFLLPLADKQHCKFLSEKTPNNVLIFAELIALFPRARFIHVIRDPRAIIASMLQVGKRGQKKGQKTQDFTRNISAAIGHVQDCFRAGLAAAELAPERVLTVAYEELVAHPERATKRLCNFLEVEWTDRLTRPGDQDHLGERPICNDVWYDRKTFNRNPVTQEIDKWKRQLTLWQKAKITAAFRDFDGLDQLGYDFSAESASPLEAGLSAAYSLMGKLLLRRRLSNRLRKIGKTLKKPAAGLTS